VEMWFIRSATPASITAATESPPPTIVVAPEAAKAWAIPRVPVSKGGRSKTPIGPFHTIVLARPISAEYRSTVRGPMSRPASLGPISPVKHIRE